MSRRAFEPTRPRDLFNFSQEFWLSIKDDHAPCAAPELLLHKPVDVRDHVVVAHQIGHSRRVSQSIHGSCIAYSRLIQAYQMHIVTTCCKNSQQVFRQSRAPGTLVSGKWPLTIWREEFVCVEFELHWRRPSEVGLHDVQEVLLRRVPTLVTDADPPDQIGRAHV